MEDAAECIHIICHHKPKKIKKRHKLTKRRCTGYIFCHRIIIKLNRLKRLCDLLRCVVRRFHSEKREQAHRKKKMRCVASYRKPALWLSSHPIRGAG